ncbi:MAG: CBS domain-containing protein [Myxococcales bacterium]|nr:CBS domain-containing protein [Myxococcales bacterium]
MGVQDITVTTDPVAIRAFTRKALADLEQLEGLLDDGAVFERGVRRMGVEQEFFLVDGRGLAAPVGWEVLERLSHRPGFTNELARFNLEANLPPRTLGGDMLRVMEAELLQALADVDAVNPPGVRALLTGILPTLRIADLSRENMTPVARYTQLDEALKALQGGRFRVAIRGLDALEVEHDSVMLEAANTSLQLHLQVDPEDFAHKYNLAQLISGPLLAAAVNSPFFLGRRLWAETRVALFQQATDDRSAAEKARGRLPRVFFGSRWVDASVLEVFRESCTRFAAILGDVPPTRDEPGEPPRLTALCAHNGTVWRWNRACYGVAGGKAHLRIENRVLPAGPTVLDEVANAAFFYGLMEGMDEPYRDLTHEVAFQDARANFLEAARQGLAAPMRWRRGKTLTARDLILGELYERAAEGLARLEVPTDDVDRYLGTLRERVARGQTGSTWLMDSLATLEGTGTRQQNLQRITQEAMRHQASGQPVHAWPPINPQAEVPREQTVRQIMSTDLYTIHPEEALERAVSIMSWNRIRHLPVEDRQGNLLGVVELCALPPMLTKHKDDDEPLPVFAAMRPVPPQVHPDTPARDALSLLLASQSHCLFVVENEQLLGLVTERDFLAALL